MKRTLVAIFVGTLCTLQAQDSNYSQQRTTGGQSQQPVTRLNKSSTLAGTEVRTRSNERIGDVKDVVIDLNSGRIAYFVVDASEILEGNNSLIAVPPFAVRPGSNQRAIMVDAEREKIENLRSFSRDNYPPIRGSIAQMSRWRSPNAEEPTSQKDYSRQQRQARRATSSQGDTDSDWYYYEWYVLTPDSDFSTSESRQSEQGRGAYGRTESESAYSNQQNSRTSPRANQQSRSTRQSRQTDDRTSGYSDYSGADHGAADVETERYSSKNESGENSRRGAGVSGSYQSSQSESTERSRGNSSDSQNSETQVFYGQIKDIHYGNRTLTVESDRKTLNFKVAEQPKLTLNNDEGNARLNHFHEGQWVKIEYRFENDSNTAHSITETGYIAPNRGE